jgi:uncharacterized protein (DUF1697 family)
MQRYVAFLRGINLGKRRLSMDKLASVFKEMGYRDVDTFIASGNVLFSSLAKDIAALEAKLSSQLESVLGYQVDTFVRKASAVVAIAESKMFPDDGAEGVTIHVAFLHEELSPDIGRKLERVRTPTDEFRVSSREYYWLCRTRTSESKVWKLPEVRALRLPSATMRNLKSVRKLVAQHLHRESG